MKRLIVFALAMALLLALCPFALGDGEGERVELTPENWSEYFTVAPEYKDKLQDVDITDIQGAVTFKPKPSAEGAVEVPITLDNWEQYFEIKEYRDEQTDAFGDAELAIITYYVDVREPYADHLVTELENHVAFMFDFDNVSHFIWVGDTGYGSPKDAAANLQGSGDYRFDEDVFPSQGSALFETQGLEMYDETFRCYERSISGTSGYEEYFSPEDRMVPAQECVNFAATRVEGSIFLSGVDPDATAPAEEPAAEGADASGWLSPE